MKTRRLTMGIQYVGSMWGNPSHEHNLLMQAEMDAHDNARVLVGIHPDWILQAPFGTFDHEMGWMTIREGQKTKVEA